MVHETLPVWSLAAWRSRTNVMATADDVRRIALSLPETTERPSYGQPGFRVKDKLFARLHENGFSLVLHVPMEDRDVMVEDEPEKFFYTDHYRKYPYVLLRFAEVDEEELRAYLIMAWRLSAPRRTLQQFGNALLA